MYTEQVKSILYIFELLKGHIEVLHLMTLYQTNTEDYTAFTANTVHNHVT